MFALARDGHEDEARAQIRLSLQARQAALSTAVARLLVENNESEEQTAARVQGIYDQVQRQVYWFLAATLVAIAATSLYLIRSNRRLFARLDVAVGRAARARAAAHHHARVDAARDRPRAARRVRPDADGDGLDARPRRAAGAAEDSPLRADLREIGEVAQATLDNVRGLSQTLHPSILEEVGLESTIDWYLSTVERQLGITVAYERTRTAGAGRRDRRHPRLSRAAGSAEQRRAAFGADRRPGSGCVTASALELEVEDHGTGMPAVATGGAASAW